MIPVGDIEVLLARQKSELLTKLRDEVERRKASMMGCEFLYNAHEFETGLNIFDGLLALLEKAGE